MDILGSGSDAIVAVLVIGVWFIVMRFILPRLGVST